MTENTAAAKIADHGLIGDLRSSALVDSRGTIDWYCSPRFDSPSVFARLLDSDRGGAWEVEAIGDNVRQLQFYLPDTNILITRYLTDAGVAEVHDFMPVLKPHDPDHRQRLVRRISGVRGDMTLRMRLSARPNYGAEHPETTRVDQGVLITSASVRLGLGATTEVELADGDVTSEFRLSADDSVLFVLETLPDGADVEPCTAADSARLFDATAEFWRRWLATSTYTGRWRETIDRSALTLKLLTHEPTGAIIAAPTTSLPEKLGGVRNWDYRYVWIRDAAFSLYALLHLGFTDEAADFVRWLSERLGDHDQHSDGLGPLRVLYDIDGNIPEDETELEHLAGYAGSRPVRVGNAAAGQLQLDIYGELIDSVYLFNKYGDGISYDSWRDLVTVLEWLIDNWQRDDAGMWEVRGRTQANLSSRMMCWVAIERMIRTARQRGLPGDIAAWSRVRDEIYERIMTEGWDADVGAFMAHEGADTVDASALLMPMVKFLAANDPRFVSTLRVIEERLVSDSLVFRYDAATTDDGVHDEDGDEEGGGSEAGAEGTFSLCSFWYVEALTRTGRLDEARLALEKMFTYANHLGLYAEQIGLNGEQLGNFPQAFTHLALISAATNLDRELG